MSVPTTCHGYDGTGWGLSGSFALAFLDSWQYEHFDTRFSISSLIRGQIKGLFVLPVVSSSRFLDDPGVASPISFLSIPMV